MFNCIDIYNFIPVSFCVGIPYGHQCTALPEHTCIMLLRRPWCGFHSLKFCSTNVAGDHVRGRLLSGLLFEMFSEFKKDFK